MQFDYAYSGKKWNFKKEQYGEKVQGSVLFCIYIYMCVQNHVTDEHLLCFLYSYLFVKFHSVNVTVFCSCFVIMAFLKLFSWVVHDLEMFYSYLIYDLLCIFQSIFFSISFH